MELRRASAARAFAKSSLSELAFRSLRFCAADLDSLGLAACVELLCACEALAFVANHCKFDAISGLSSLAVELSVLDARGVDLPELRGCVDSDPLLVDLVTAEAATAEPRRARAARALAAKLIKFDAIGGLLALETHPVELDADGDLLAFAFAANLIKFEAMSGRLSTPFSLPAGNVCESRASCLSDDLFLKRFSELLKDKTSVVCFSERATTPE